MSNYVRDAFERVDIQHIREYILTGGTCEVEKGGYEERLEKAVKPIFNRLDSLYPDME